MARASTSAPAIDLDAPVPAPVSDTDGDGRLDLDPRQVETTLADLVAIDHDLRDHGTSIAVLIKTLASNQLGIKL